jgi:arylsulfatase A-like enzyme
MTRALRSVGRADLSRVAAVIVLALVTDRVLRALAPFPSASSWDDLAAGAVSYAILTLPAVLALTWAPTRRAGRWLLGLPFGLVLASAAAAGGASSKIVLALLGAGALVAGIAMGRLRLRVVAAAVALLACVAAWQTAANGWRTADAAAPSVLLVVLDTVSARHLSTYGYGRPTDPALAALARRGMLYKRAVSTAPWTVPSHASIFTGQYPSELGFDGANFSAPVWPGSLAGDLRQQGFQTVGLTANPGLTGWPELGNGFDRLWSEHRLAARPAALLVDWLLGREATYQTRGERITDLALDWLDRHSTRGRPWMLFLNYLDAHAPYDPPPRLRDTFAPGAEHLTADNRPYNTGALPASAATTESMRQLYDAEVAAMDEALGRLLAGLHARGYDQSKLLVVVTADHGESFGEHGFYGHLLGMPDTVLHVPLVLAGYGVPQGVVDESVQPLQIRSTVDTILDLPLSDRAAAPLPPWGSGPEFLISEHPQPKWYLRGLEGLGTPFTPDPRWLGNWTAVEHGGIKVVFDETLTRGGTYDLAADPDETRPQPLGAGRASLDRYRTWRTALAANRPAAPSELSEAAKERLRAVGYMQ